MTLLAYSGVIQTLHRGQQLICVGEEIAIWSVNNDLSQVAAANAHKSASQVDSLLCVCRLHAAISTLCSDA